MFVRFAAITAAATAVLAIAVLAPTAIADIDIRSEVVVDSVDGLPTARDDDGDPVVTAEGAHDHHDDGAHVGEGDGDGDGAVLSEPTPMPIAFSLVGVAMPAEAEVAVRHRAAGGEWGDWQSAHTNPDEGPDPPAESGSGDGEPTSYDDEGRVMSLPVWTGEADELQLRVQGARPEDVAVHLVDGLGQNQGALGRVGDVASAVVRALRPAGRPAAAAIDRPRIVRRGEWGAIPGGRPSYARSARGAAVHHTVTSNSYSRSQAPAVVRSIQRYHMHHQGWKDIGYNFLVDRYGTIYEGRRGGITKPVVGAHAAGHNTGSIGVAFIGQHHARARGYQSLRHAAGRAAIDLLSWKFKIHRIDADRRTTLPSGFTYPSWSHRIIGHSTLGNTSCPGSSVNAWLPTIRRGVLAAQREDRDTSGPTIPDDLLSLQRLAGSSRQATAATVSRAVHDEADYVVIASAFDFPDALAGAGLAGRLDAPVLLNSTHRLDAATAEEIERLGASRAVILGSHYAISNRVGAALDARGLTVHRVAGTDRFDTAARVADFVHGTDAVLVTSGTDGWPDAVAASQLAAAEERPVLLTTRGAVPPATREALARLRPEKITVIGGPNAVSHGVARELGRYGSVERIAGADRTETAALVAERALAGGADDERVWLASAMNWPDALAAGPAAAARGEVLALTWRSQLREDTGVGARLSSAREALVVGGPLAVSRMVEHRAAQIVEQ